MSIRPPAVAPAAKPRQLGFTLIEALVVMAILAILTAMAAPAYRGIIERFRFDAVREALGTTIQMARLEAIRTGRQVNIAPQVCAAADWSCGWLVYVDLDADGVQDANEPTFRRDDVVVAVSITKNNNPNLLTISRFGQAAGVLNTTFEIGPQPAGTISPNCRSLVLNSAMRQTSATGNTVCPPTP